MTRGDRVRLVLRGIGQLLMTLGVVVLLFCVYELKITSIYTFDSKELPKLYGYIIFYWYEIII